MKDKAKHTKQRADRYQRRARQMNADKAYTTLKAAGPAVIGLRGPKKQIYASLSLLAFMLILAPYSAGLTAGVAVAALIGFTVGLGRLVIRSKRERGKKVLKVGGIAPQRKKSLKRKYKRKWKRK